MAIVPGLLALVASFAATTERVIAGNPSIRVYPTTFMALVSGMKALDT